MKVPATLALLGVLLSACASSHSVSYVESGYQPGALAVAAIHRGDWGKAEELLGEARGATARDPARLINLGKVYFETGRIAKALSAWQLALASDRHHMVETADGNWVSTEELARTALARYDTKVRSASLQHD